VQIDSKFEKEKPNNKKVKKKTNILKELFHKHDEYYFGTAE
jgi:hypothetical protein